MPSKAAIQLKKQNRAKKKKPTSIPLPSAGDWRSKDEIEILRRIQRARDEKHAISNLQPQHPVFSTFAVQSHSGMTYQVEISRPRQVRMAKSLAPQRDRPYHL